MQDDAGSESYQMQREDVCDAGRRQGHGDHNRQPDNDVALQRVNAAVGGESAIEGLELHMHSPATCYTPMERFLAESPTQAPQAWLARIAVKDIESAESGEGGEDAEMLDARKYATEMADDDVAARRVEETIVDSPRASSDTLSLAHCHETLGRPSQPVREKCGGHVSYVEVWGAGGEQLHLTADAPGTEQASLSRRSRRGGMSRPQLRG
jgi:hypothetical protein